MAQRVDRQRIVENFLQFARVLVPGAKAVLTCRTEHFPDAQQTWESLAEDAKTDGLNPSALPHFERAYLFPFTQDQLRDVLTRRGASSHTIESILARRELREIALRPLLVELVMEALDEVNAGAEVDVARIYLYAVRRKLEREIEEGRTFLSLADKLYFMYELSWEMLHENRMSLHYREFPDRLRRLFGGEVAAPSQLDHWQWAMQRNTLLVRNDEGEYSPAHRSLAEFFVTYKYVAELGALAPDFLGPAQARYADIDPAAVPAAQTWSEYFRRGGGSDADACKTRPLLAFLPEPEARFEDCSAVVDLDDLPPATLAFAADMVSTDEAEFGKLCEMAWEESGQRSWNVLRLLPHLKHRCSARLVDALVATLDTGATGARHAPRVLQSGVCWVLGELGIPSEPVVAALKQTVEAVSREAGGTPQAWWECGFALEKLGVLGKRRGPQGETALTYLLGHLAPGCSAEAASGRLLVNLRASDPDGARVIQFDVDSIAGAGQTGLVDHFFAEALPLVDWSKDPAGRRCYFMVWLCGHLARRDAIDQVVEATRHPHSSVRNCASEALGKIGILTPEVLAALIHETPRLCGSGHSVVR
jgi:hypothetical protein